MSVHSKAMRIDSQLINTLLIVLNCNNLLIKIRLFNIGKDGRILKLRASVETCLHELLNSTSKNKLKHFSYAY